MSTSEMSLIYVVPTLQIEDVSSVGHQYQPKRLHSITFIF